MSLSENQCRELGHELYDALRECRTLVPLSDRYTEITVADAYRISEVMLALRLEKDGEQVVGKKIGVTSAAVQEMLGVFQPDFGFLTDKMAVPNGGEVVIAGNLIQPRAEAEIAFLLKEELKGPKITEADVLRATDCIMPCFEIVDSRIDGWKIKIQDTVADNASCGVYLTGNEKIDPNKVNMPDLEVQVYKNGIPISSGKGSAVQGNPLTAVAWLANTLGEFGTPLRASEVILSGSLVPLEPVTAGDRMHMELVGLGSATISFA